MHILFFTQCFPPEVNAPANRTYDHCKEWVNNGHKVTVITCAPNHPKGILFDGYKNKLIQTENINNINVIRVWSFITPNKGLFKRVLGHMTFIPMSLIAGLFVRKVDLVIGTSPQIFSPLIAWLISIFKRIPWVFEIRDILSESLLATMLIKKKNLLSLVETFESFLYKRASLIIVVTNGFKRILVNHGIDENKIHVITNGVDLKKFIPTEKNSNLADSLNLNNSFIVGYIGTHGLAQGLDSILNAAEIIQEKYKNNEIKFLFIGDGAEKNKLMLLAKRLNLDNVIFLDIVPREVIKDYWSILDISIVHLNNTPIFNNTIPSKIFESMAMRVPLLHCVPGESSEIVVQNKVGLLAEPGNVENIANEIIKMSNMQEELNLMRDNCSNAVQKYNRSCLAKHMLKIMQMTVNS